MFLSKKSLSRRAVLRGAGSCIALPLLDAMLPAQTKTPTAPVRLLCLEMVHGAAGSTPYGTANHLWSPAATGPNVGYSYTLKPLEPLRDFVTIVSNTDARQGEAITPAEGGADHFRSSALFLTAAHAQQGPQVHNGVSIDQLYAQHIGNATRIPSLRLCIENIGLSGSCGFNYNCAYLDTISWASPTEPLSMEVNPRRVFEQLFGHSERGSVLDSTDLASLRLQLGNADRARVDAFLERVRSAERTIQQTERRNAMAPARERPEAPLGVPDAWEDHVMLMFELQLLALEADLTRAIAFKMSRDTNNRVFPGSGVRQPFHTLSHHVERPELIRDFAKINRYHVQVLTRFLERLRTTSDGDGSLLDQSLVLYGSPMGDSNTHNHRQLPILLAGRAGGRHKGNLHYAAQPGTPHANTLVTILDKLNVPVPQLSDSTGTLSI